MKNLCNKNFKTLEKEIEVDTRRQKDLPCAWVERINIVKMVTSPKQLKI